MFGYIAITFGPDDKTHLFKYRTDNATFFLLIFMICAHDHYKAYNSL